jgi:hypothetical protein
MYPTNFYEQNRLSGVGSMQRHGHRAEGDGSMAVFGQGLRGFPIFGSGIPHDHIRIPQARLDYELYNYRRQHHLPQTGGALGLPLNHLVGILKHGEKHGLRGGFLPLAGLLPMIGPALGSLASMAGPALLTGAAGSLGKSGMDGILGRIFGGNGLPPMKYDAREKTWLVHGEGWKDVFRSILSRARDLSGRIFRSKAAQGLISHGKDTLRDTANAGKDALLAAAKDFIEGKINRFGGTSEKEETPPLITKLMEPSPGSTEENVVVGSGYRKRRNYPDTVGHGRKMKTTKTRRYNPTW